MALPLDLGLDRIAEAPSILDAIRLTPVVVRQVSAAARRSTGASRSLVLELRSVAGDAADTVTGVAAVHALGAIPGSAADRALTDLLGIGPAALREHVAWTTAQRVPAHGLIDPLIELLASGGLAGMHAHATLARWAAAGAPAVTDRLRAALLGANAHGGRHLLVETLGLVTDPQVRSDLIRLALDRDEADVVRVTAVAALGDRLDAPLPAAVVALARSDGRVAEAVRLAESDRLVRVDHGTRSGGGLRDDRSIIPDAVRVAQVHLGAPLDAGLLHAGMGDTGGIATLLVKLGSALALDPRIAEVVTIGRGTTSAALDPRPIADSHRFAPVALEPEAGTSFGDAWPARIAAARGLRRVLREGPRPDILHLRMADVGTLAAAEVAAAMRIPIVFSLAPDPHALIAAREEAGALDRRTFGAEDAQVHLWYRAALVERLARQAQHIVLFPREQLAAQLRTLVGIDVTAPRGRYTVVPEGIDVRQVRRAVAAREEQEHAAPRHEAGRPGERELAPGPASSALDDLVDQLAARPASRQGLPIVVSVGRLNELKGMARLVEAFAGDPDLRARATLVIVGGDLDKPNPTEAAELARIAAVHAAQPAVADAIVLLGHRPNGEVAELLAAAALGVAPVIGPAGAYACASRKEEFGLAIVEAMTAGLAVVAPLIGGPATYIEAGFTGVLVDTGDPAALAQGVKSALDLAGLPGRAAHAVRTMTERHDISAMAERLATIYSELHAASTELLAS